MKRRRSREVNADMRSRPPAIVKVTLGFTHSKLSVVHFHGPVPSNKLTHLPGHYSHFYPLLHEKVVHKPIQLCSKCFIAQALTECAQLAASVQCLHLTAQELSPKLGRPEPGKPEVLVN